MGLGISFGRRIRICDLYVSSAIVGTMRAIIYARVSTEEQKLFGYGLGQELVWQKLNSKSLEMGPAGFEPATARL